MALEIFTYNLLQNRLRYTEKMGERTVNSLEDEQSSSQTATIVRNGAFDRLS